MAQTQSSTWLYWKLRLMTVFWGGTFIAGRMVVQTVEPLTAAFCRYAIATLLLLLLTWRLEGGLPRLSREQAVGVLLLGMTGVFGYNTLFFLGLSHTSASRAALVITTNPAFIALGAAILFQEHLSALKIMGILSALLGAMIVISRGDLSLLISAGFSVGDLYLLGCIATWTIYSLLGRKMMRSLSPFAATTYACLVGTPCLMIPAWQAGVWSVLPSFSLTVWVNLFYLGALGTVLAFCWYYEGMQAIGTAQTAIFINFVPVVAVILASLFLGEKLTGAIALGGSLVVLGIYLMNRRDREE